jgi:archaeosine synthase
MTIFFELLKKKIGFSRIGRLSIIKQDKRYFLTPNIIIPLHSSFANQADFIDQFKDHDFFMFSEETYFKKDFFKENVESKNFIFTHKGTLDKFQEIISRYKQEIIRNNIIVLIPFNIPTTAINKDFAEQEVKNYLNSVNIILKNHSGFTYGLTIRVFDFFELFNLYFDIVKNNDNITILNLADQFDNFSQFRKIIRNILTMKQNLDNNLVLMASGRIIPKFYPMLIYLGIDLIDSAFLLYLSSENFYDTIEHLLPIYKIKYLPCSCIACRGKLKNLLEEKYSTEKIDLLALHNLISAKIYINKIRQYLNYEDFRAFVEKSSLDDTNLISILRILDRQYFEIIRYETPITQKNRKINCLGASSYNRPDFQEFRERTIRTFEPEQNTRLIILFPCSAVKPYSDSKSHKKFQGILRKFPEFPDFQEIILTSPLGAIPRQLENIYPVNSYDIPVTGDWDNEELNITTNMLIKLLQKYNHNIPVVVHLEDVYLEIINKAKQKIKNEFYFSDITKKITSKESLQSLKSLISSKIYEYHPESESYETSSFTRTWTRKFAKILDYQYGSGSAAKIFIKKVKIKKGRNNTQLELLDTKDNHSIGVFKYDTGQIDLSIQGASLLTPFSSLTNKIVFNGKKITGTTLFRPGILEYSNDLIPRNNVIILNETKENIIGMGHLIVGSNVIKNTKSGRVAIIYDKI